MKDAITYAHDAGFFSFNVIGWKAEFERLIEAVRADAIADHVRDATNMVILTEEAAQQIEVTITLSLGYFPETVDGGVAIESAKKSLAAIRAARAQEQAEQKPVAWLWRMHGWAITAQGKHRAIKTHVDVCKPPVETQASDDFIDLTPLYAAPVRTKDLTDDELNEIIGEKIMDMRMTYQDLCRNAIADDREKNK